MNWKTTIRQIFLLGLIVVLSGVIVTAQGDASVRFVHAVPGVSGVDVYVNGSLAATDLEYGTATNYITVPAGDHNVSVNLSGTATELWQQAITAGADTTTTFLASSASAPTFDAYNENLTATQFGFTRLLLLHAIADGPAVDVLLAEPVVLNGELQEAGTALANGMEYRGGFGDFDLPAQTYTVNVLPTGGTANLVEGLPLALNAGTSNIAIVYGTPDAPEALLVQTATDASADSGFVRFIHGVAGAPAVDVYVNDILIAPSLSLDMPTAHIALPAGDHSVLLRAAGTEDEIVAGDLSVVVGEAQSIVAVLAGDAVELSAVADDISGVTTDGVVASVTNIIIDSVIDVTLSDGTILASGLGYGETASAVVFAPSVTSASMGLTIGDQSGVVEIADSAFYGGNYYNIIALPGDMFNAPSLLLSSTNLAQGLASAPGADMMVVTAPETQPEVVTAPDANDAPTTDVVATPEPVTIDEATAPSVVPEEAITGVILLDPGANLQLRLLPDGNAQSLGLAPSGSTLLVVGREGAPVALVEGQEPPAEAADFVDPATLLGDPDADIDPTATWVRVIFATADGGEIEAWTLAQFLEVRDDEGDLQRLADLELVGGNIPGQARNTDVTPPPPPEQRVTAIVFNLNPDAALNVRRTPTVDGEVLARLPLGTVSEFGGLIEADETTGESAWAFITYLAPEGGSISGWVSTQFIEYQYNGNDSDLEEIQARELLQFISPDVIGEVNSTASVTNLPTPDPTKDAYIVEVILDQGANLQFRRFPDATTESLGLIPAGTFVIASSRTADGLWLEVEFEGAIGWISSQFVAITFNGDIVEPVDVPVNTNVTVPGAAPALVTEPTAVPDTTG